MRQPNDTQIAIFIDIDRTIVNDKGIVYKGAIEVIKRLAKKANIYIWSAGGYEYSLETVKRFNLTNDVCGALPKPNYTIDDLDVKSPFSKNIIPNWKILNIFEQMLVGKFNEDFDVFT